MLIPGYFELNTYNERKFTEQKFRATIALDQFLLSFMGIVLLRIMSMANSNKTVVLEKLQRIQGIDGEATKQLVRHADDTFVTVFGITVSPLFEIAYLILSMAAWVLSVHMVGFGNYRLWQGKTA